jgi:hypothetical protein
LASAAPPDVPRFTDDQRHVRDLIRRVTAEGTNKIQCNIIAPDRVEPMGRV